MVFRVFLVFSSYHVFFFSFYFPSFELKCAASAHLNMLLLFVCPTTTISSSFVVVVELLKVKKKSYYENNTVKKKTVPKLLSAGDFCQFIENFFSLLKRHLLPGHAFHKLKCHSSLRSDSNDLISYSYII